MLGAIIAKAKNETIDNKLKCAYYLKGRHLDTRKYF